MTKSNPPAGSSASPLAGHHEPTLPAFDAGVHCSGAAISSRANYAIGEIDPLALSTMRWVGAFVLIAPFAWPACAPTGPKSRARLVAGSLFYGAIGFTTFNVLLYAATTYTTAVNIAMIQAAIPVLVMVGNFVLFKVRASLLQILGVALAISASSTSRPRAIPRASSALDVNFGDVLMLIACLIYAAYSLALRFKPNIHWMSFIAVTSFFAALAAIVYQIAFSTGLGGLARRSWLA